MQLRQNVSPEVHTIERAIVAPPHNGTTLLRGRERRGAAAASGVGRRIVPGQPRIAVIFASPAARKAGDHSALRGLFAPIRQTLIAVETLADREAWRRSCGRHLQPLRSAPIVQRLGRNWCSDRASERTFMQARSREGFGADRRYDS